MFEQSGSKGSASQQGLGGVVGNLRDKLLAVVLESSKFGKAEFTRRRKDARGCEIVHVMCKPCKIGQVAVLDAEDVEIEGMGLVRAGT